MASKEPKFAKRPCLGGCGKQVKMYNGKRGTCRECRREAVKCGTDRAYVLGCRCAECKAFWSDKYQSWSKSDSGKSWRSAYNKTYYEENVDDEKARTLEWKRTHPEFAQNVERNRRAAKRNGDGRLPTNHMRVMIEHYGERCAKCGNTDRPLTFDHIIPLSKAGEHSFRNGQLLCGPCNSSKKDLHSTDYRDWSKGVLAGMLFNEPMLLFRSQ